MVVNVGFFFFFFFGCNECKSEMELKSRYPYFSKTPFQHLNGVTKLATRTQTFLPKWSFEENEMELCGCHTNPPLVTRF
ncbi:hypothetical protein P167DRAFT_432327 [Morchella conica CCBAS932]|uniref:Secreted protein n=1 Tax=Morchella conica CCBAS932 TaxID=1392247 RepID=A0A3N4KY65_9PEZI|nr:hypothetical protein P167DRAFT_432327 [Morchella conica CCBAS932]